MRSISFSLLLSPSLFHSPSISYLFLSLLFSLSLSSRALPAFQKFRWRIPERWSREVLLRSVIRIIYLCLKMYSGKRANSAKAKPPRTLERRVVVNKREKKYERKQTVAISFARPMITNEAIDRTTSRNSFLQNIWQHDFARASIYNTVT